MDLDNHSLRRMYPGALCDQWLEALHCLDSTRPGLNPETDPRLRRDCLDIVGARSGSPAEVKIEPRTVCRRRRFSRSTPSVHQCTARENRVRGRRRLFSRCLGLAQRHAVRRQICLSSSVRCSLPTPSSAWLHRISRGAVVREYRFIGRIFLAAEGGSRAICLRTRVSLWNRLFLHARQCPDSADAGICTDQFARHIDDGTDGRVQGQSEGEPARFSGARIPGARNAKARKAMAGTITHQRGGLPRRIGARPTMVKTAPKTRPTDWFDGLWTSSSRATRS